MTTKRSLRDQRFLELLARNFPNIDSASQEIINLSAILNLPKGTEHFVADLHGESEAFTHIMKNASGRIRRKVDELFESQLSESQINDLCTLIYYPEQKLEIVKASNHNIDEFYRDTLLRLILVLQVVTRKFTRSKVRKALPQGFAYIIEELLHESPEDKNKQAYFQAIIQSIIETGQTDGFITAMCNVIQRLSVDQLHILGDIFDRGPGAHTIMERLMHTPNFDIQWGNHDVLWMGAAAGNTCCIANVLRLSLRFGNLATLEDGYGINLLPLATFAMETYADDPCSQFLPQLSHDDPANEPKTLRMVAQMHKAISIIQFKLEAQMIDRHPEWQLQHRQLINAIDVEKGSVTIGKRTYMLTDTLFPTLNAEDPSALSREEKSVMKQIQHSFLVSEKLQQHIRCLLSHGSMYGIYNGNLLFHASVPLNADGTLREISLPEGTFAGKEMMEQIEGLIRQGFNSDLSTKKRNLAIDYFWYHWCGPDSPFFDKDKMTTFERYFIKDKATHTEQKGHYYDLRNDPAIVDSILDAFGVEGEQRHIINGHVPVHVAKGESPIRAGGKLMVIDGGFAKPYHVTTGIAGYTLVYHSRGFELIQHEPFTSAKDAIRKGKDIVSSRQLVELSGHRLRVADTDMGRKLQQQIDELQELLYAYRHGIIKERR